MIIELSTARPVSMSSNAKVIKLLHYAYPESHTGDAITLYTPSLSSYVVLAMDSPFGLVTVQSGVTVTIIV